jgi:hypothetical protein
MKLKLMFRDLGYNQRIDELMSDKTIIYLNVVCFVNKILLYLKALRFTI